MKNALLLPAILTVILSWNFAAKNSSPPVVVTGANMNVGSSVAGMPCPDPAMTWPCSIASSTGKAPLPVGCQVLLSKNNAGRLVVEIPKENLSPFFKSNWIKDGQFYTPQTIEMERSLSLTVLDTDSAYYIDPGTYPMVETASGFIVTF